MMRTCAAFGVVGLCWADRLPLKTGIASMTRALFMFTPEKKIRWTDPVAATEQAVWGQARGRRPPARRGVEGGGGSATRWAESPACHHPYHTPANKTRWLNI